jgi:hypothetical protein
MLAVMEAISAKQTLRIKEFMFIQVQRFWVLEFRVQSYTVNITLSREP